MSLNIWFIRSARLFPLFLTFEVSGCGDICGWFVLVVAVVGVVISGFDVIDVADACFWDCRENVVMAFVSW